MAVRGFLRTVYGRLKSTARLTAELPGDKSPGGRADEFSPSRLDNSRRLPAGDGGDWRPRKAVCGEHGGVLRGRAAGQGCPRFGDADRNRDRHRDLHVSERTWLRY